MSYNGGAAKYHKGMAMHINTYSTYGFKLGPTVTRFVLRVDFQNNTEISMVSFQTEKSGCVRLARRDETWTHTVLFCSAELR